METREIEPDVRRFRGIRTPDGPMLLIVVPSGAASFESPHFDWGDEGEWYGRLRLAETLMLYVLGGERVSLTNCERVAREKIAALPEDGWELSYYEVQEWFAGMRILAH